MEPDRGWSAVARFWGIAAGLGFIVASLLYTADVLGWIGTIPAYASTSAGQLQDEATYWAAVFAYRHAILWDVMLRDGIFFFSFIGLLPVLLAANEATGGRRAALQVGSAFVGVAAIFGALNAVAFYVDVEYWRNTGWDAVPATVMVIVGRGSQLLDALSSKAGMAEQVVLAVGLAYIGLACRREAALPSRLAPVAWIGSVLLALLVVVPWLPFDTGHAWDLIALIVGVVIAPAIAISLGLHLGRVLRNPIAGAAA